MTDQRMRVEAYTDENRKEWDAFVAGSRNGTFLHSRGYLGYHADRFEDCSLLVRDDEGTLLALLPAERRGASITSHGGITYGGLVVDSEMTAPRMLHVLEAVVLHLRRVGGESLLYKTIPRIYHRLPAEEDLYALFRLDARLVRRDILTVVERGRRAPVQQRRARAIRKAARRGLEVRRTDDWGGFWRVLSENLLGRFGVAPVHSVQEIELLAARFPDEIHLHGAYRDGELVAGAVLYRSPDVCHVQYNAASEVGRACGALDLLLETLLVDDSLRARYFDFGASTEERGRVLNVGLVDYKEGFGGRTVVHDFYELDLAITV